MSMIGVYIGYSLALGEFTFNLSILYAMLAVFCISGGGQAINDYFDYDVDKRKKSARPLASGLISRKNGLFFSIGLFLLGMVLASFLNNDAFWIAVFFSALLILYSWLMREIKFVGNIIVALGTGFTFIFGASVISVTPLVLMIAFAAFLANWAREIIKDVEDKNEDKGIKITLPHILKSHQVTFVIWALLLLTLIAGYLPVVLGQSNLYYTLLVTAANIVFILAGKEIHAQHATKAQSLMKKGMIIALVAALVLV